MPHQHHKILTFACPGSNFSTEYELVLAPSIYWTVQRYVLLDLLWISCFTWNAMEDLLLNHHQGVCLGPLGCFWYRSAGVSHVSWRNTKGNSRHIVELHVFFCCFIANEGILNCPCERVATMCYGVAGEFQTIAPDNIILLKAFFCLNVQVLKEWIRVFWITAILGLSFCPVVGNIPSMADDKFLVSCLFLWALLSRQH